MFYSFIYKIPQRKHCWHTSAVCMFSAYILTITPCHTYIVGSFALLKVQLFTISTQIDSLSADKSKCKNQNKIIILNIILKKFYIHNHYKCEAQYYTFNIDWTKTKNKILLFAPPETDKICREIYPSRGSWT